MLYFHVHRMVGITSCTSDTTKRLNRVKPLTSHGLVNSPIPQVQLQEQHRSGQDVVFTDIILTTGSFGGAHGYDVTLTTSSGALIGQFDCPLEALRKVATMFPM